MALWDSFNPDVRRLDARSVAKDMAGWLSPFPAKLMNLRLKLYIDIAAPDGDPAGCDVVIETRGKQYKTRLRWKTLALATHYTLDCPVTGKRVRSLYAVNDRVGSREALGLRYASRHAPRSEQREGRYLRLSLMLNGDGVRKAARRGNRDRILSQLSELDLDQMDDRDQRAVLKWRRNCAVSDLSMQAALGRGLGNYRAFSPPRELDRIAAAAPSPDLAPRPRAVLHRQGRYPMIDLSALAQAPQEHNGRGWVLEYPEGSVVFAEQDGGVEGTRLRLGCKGKPSVCQIFPLTELDGALQTPCPVTGKPTEALFLRHGRWASAKAQRLS